MLNVLAHVYELSKYDGEIAGIIPKGYYGQHLHEAQEELLNQNPQSKKNLR